VQEKNQIPSLKRFLAIRYTVSDRSPKAQPEFYHEILTAGLSTTLTRTTINKNASVKKYRTVQNLGFHPFQWSTQLLTSSYMYLPHQ